MATNEDEKLDEMLRLRRIQAASPDLARRIVLKAQNTPQIQAFSLRQWIKQTFAELHLPKPAYVLAGTLVMGFVVGLNIPSETLTDNSDAVQAQIFLDSDEGIL
jgi:hypothetical protein